jgi:hypothetical protein
MIMAANLAPTVPSESTKAENSLDPPIFAPLSQMLDIMLNQPVAMLPIKIQKSSD